MADKEPIELFDIRSKLRFNKASGHIWLDENRMMLIHARAMGAMRKELFETVGEKQAQAILWRMGFIGGQMDADLALKMFGNADNQDVFNIGPAMHGLEGIVRSTITEADFDWEKGSFEGKVDLENSWEVEAHLEAFGQEESATACWTVVGYASGYVSRFFKRYVVFREIECCCSGAKKCRIEGKPIEDWDPELVVDFLSRSQEDPPQQEIELELRELRAKALDGDPRRSRPDTGRIVGESEGFLRAFDLLAKAAPSPINVMLLGETGVGKEVFARWMHENSDRSDEPFIAVNCGAIPLDLIESELFGVRRGAFTGADQARPGRFERADGGTLFLDEIGDLPPSAQVKLLRVLQSGEVERLGDTEVRKVDVRIVSATNINLRDAVREGRFRADLFYRLSPYPVEIPPLRDRLNDIPILAAAMIEKFSPIYNKSVAGLTDRALRALKAYDWPGNVRELENMIERAVLLVEPEGMIEVHHLFIDAPPVGTDGSFLDTAGKLGRPRIGCDNEEDLLRAMVEHGFDLSAHEERLMKYAVEKAGGNLSEAARMLNITRRQLAYKLKTCDAAESDEE